MATIRLSHQWILISLFVHVCIIACALLLPASRIVQRRFVVFGAHSPVPTHAYFKPLKAPAVHHATAALVAPKKEVTKSAPLQKALAAAIKEPVAPKKAAPKQAAKKEVPKKVETPKKKAAPQAAPKQEQPAPSQEQSAPAALVPVAVGARDELAVDSWYVKAVQRAVRKVWHPPLGVPGGTSLKAELVLDARGRVVSHVVVSRSQSVLFDMSVMQAIPQFDFGPRCGNMKIELDFYQ